MSDNPNTLVVETPVKVKKEKKPAKPAYTGPACTVCGKPLSDPESIKLGIGPLCRKAGWTKESVAAKMSELKVETAPAGWVKIADMHKQLNVLGIPVARMVRAIGGDRGMQAPLNPDFKVVYLGRTRYISPAATNETNLALLSDKYLGVPQPEKVAKVRTPKAPKLNADGTPVAPKAKKAAKTVNADAFNAINAENFISDAK